MKKALLLVGSVLCTLLLANSTRADIATVTLSALSQTYDGTAKTVTITTDPPDLTVDVTYNGDSSAPTNAGSYTVVANVDDPTYTGSATNTLVINKAQATITATNLFPNYQGVPLMPTLTTSPVGLALNVTYSGSPDAPTLPGRYLVRAIVQDVNYQGTSSFLMRIRNSPAQITLIGLNQTYDGTPKGVTATTSP
ncbi:MAG: MBG domain-containing protein, partial [Limisphaerales bacterium]